MATWLVVGFVLMGVASLSGLGFMLYTAIRMVASGRALDTYRTFWLVEFNWLSLLILCACIVVALAVGFALRIRERMHWRELEAKYGKNRRDA
jgi:membrane protein implicated in regulation of membrane protease activity